MPLRSLSYKNTAASNSLPLMFPRALSSLVLGKPWHTRPYGELRAADSCQQSHDGAWRRSFQPQASLRDRSPGQQLDLTSNHHPAKVLLGSDHTSRLTFSLVSLVIRTWLPSLTTGRYSLPSQVPLLPRPKLMGVFRLTFVLFHSAKKQTNQ